MIRKISEIKLDLNERIRKKVNYNLKVERGDSQLNYEKGMEACFPTVWS